MWKVKRNQVSHWLERLVVVGLKATSFWNVDMLWRVLCGDWVRWGCYEEAKNVSRDSYSIWEREFCLKWDWANYWSKYGSLWMHIVHSTIPLVENDFCHIAASSCSSPRAVIIGNLVSYKYTLYMYICNLYLSLYEQPLNFVLDHYKKSLRSPE